MPRPKRYESEAEKQAAYRERKRNLGRELGYGKKEAEVDDATLGTRDVVTSVDPAGQEKSVEEGSTVAVAALPERKLTSTDQKFDEDRPGWYIFGVEVKEGKCWTCGKPFRTQLEMNRFCSPKCKNEYLATISNSKNEIPL